MNFYVSNRNIHKYVNKKYDQNWKGKKLIKHKVRIKKIMIQTDRKMIFST